MKVEDVKVGDRLDNYGYPRKLYVVTAIRPDSSHLNGEISFDEYTRRHARRRRTLTFKQFERLKFLRKESAT